MNALSPGLRLQRYRRVLGHYLARPGSGPVYVFHHIPKTGGSSVNRMLPYWFYRVRDRRIRVDPEDWTAGHRAAAPIDLGSLREGDCLAGHWAVPGEYLHERYPDVLTDPKYRLFAFVREPLELQLSLYSWEGKRGKVFHDTSMEEELLARPNYLANTLPCTADDFEEVLSRYFFIGVTERLQASFDRLADLVGRTRLKLPHANRSRTADDRPQFSPEFVSDFRSANRLDYLIYEHCSRQLAGPR